MGQGPARVLMPVSHLLGTPCAGAELLQTHENLEHLAMMEAVLGPLPTAMSGKCVRTPAGKYFNGGGRLNWPDGAATRKSVKAVKRLSGLHQLILTQGELGAGRVHFTA